MNAIVAIIIAISGLALTIIGLIVKLTTFITEIRVYVTQMRKDMHPVREIPMLDYRVRVVEKHLGVSTPSMANGHVRVDSEDEQ